MRSPAPVLHSFIGDLERHHPSTILKEKVYLFQRFGGWWPPGREMEGDRGWGSASLEPHGDSWLGVLFWILGAKIFTKSCWSVSCLTLDKCVYDEKEKERGREGEREGRRGGRESFYGSSEQMTRCLRIQDLSGGQTRQVDTRWLNKDPLMQLMVLWVTTGSQLWLLDVHLREAGAIGKWSRDHWSSPFLTLSLKGLF